MTTTRRRKIWWWLLGLLFLLPIAVYGCFPFVATTLLTEGLTQQGFKNVTIQLGHPTLDTLSIQVLAFDKDISGEQYQVTLNNIDLAYHLLQLSQGQLEHIVIGGGTINMKTPNSNVPTRTPKPTESKEPSSSQTLSLTADELLAPFPMPPFKKLTLGKVTIHRSEAHEPLQNILVDGSVDTRNATMLSHINIQGSHIPRYTITFAGTSIGDASLTVLSPTSTQPTLIHYTSQTSRDEKNLHPQGSLNIDLPNAVKLVELFAPVDPDLSAMTGTVTANWSGSLPHSVSIDSIVKEKTGAIDGTFHIQAALPQLQSYGQNIAIQANGTFAATRDELTWTLSKGSKVTSAIRVDPHLVPESVRSILPMNGHQLSVNFPQPLTGKVSLNTNSPAMTVNGLIQANYRMNNFPATIQFSLTNLSGNSIQNLEANGHFQLTGDLEKDLRPQFPLQHITWNFSGDLSLQQERLTVSLRPQSSLKTVVHPINKLQIPQVDLTFLKTFMGTYDLPEQTWATSPLVVHVNAPHVTWRDKTLAIQRINLALNTLKGSRSTWETTGEIVALGLRTTINDITPPTTNLKLLFSVNQQSLQVNVLGQTSDTQVSLYGKLQQHLLTQEGRMQFKLAPITFSPSTVSLQQMIQPWPYPLDITKGSIGAVGNITWTLPSAEVDSPIPKWQGETTLTIDDLSGLYDNMLFDSLSTAMTFTGRDTWTMPNPATLTLRQVQSGIEVSDISMKVHLSPLPNMLIPRVEISDFSSHMFGGEIFSDPFTFDSSQPKNQLTMHIKGMDIGEILKLEQQEGLEGTGLLDGTIPVTLAQDGIEVPTAKIAARPPGGVIRYQTSEATAEGVAQTSSQLDLVLQALNNFQYDVLRIEAHYQKNGTLLLNTRLEGKNPGLGEDTPLNFNGYPINLQSKPIHFNLNIEENIPALLKSLRITQGIGEHIEDLLQKSATN